MATPIIAGAALFEARKLVGRRGRRRRQRRAAARRDGRGAFVSGLLAIGFLLRYLRGHSSLNVFVVYRLVLAGVVLVVWLAALSRCRRMEVMKQLRQRAIRDLLEQRPDPDPAGARRRPSRTRLPDDPGHDQPRRRGAGPDQGDARRDAGLRAAAHADRGRDDRRGPAAQAAPRPAGRGPRGRAAAGRAHAAGSAPTPSPPRWTARAGRRSRARSPATTRSSSPSRTAARSSGSSGGLHRALDRVGALAPSRSSSGVRRPGADARHRVALTPDRSARGYHSRPGSELQARGRPRPSLEFFPLSKTARRSAHIRRIASRSGACEP